MALSSRTISRRSTALHMSVKQTTPEDVIELLSSGNVGTLSPDVQTILLATGSSISPLAIQPTAAVKRIGRYILTDFSETAAEMTGNTQTLVGTVMGRRCEPAFKLCKAICVDTQEEFSCKIFPVETYRKILAPYFIIGSHPHIACIEELIVGSTEVYAIFPRIHGDLHSYVRSKRRLGEAEAVRLFAQIVSAVEGCHENGILTRDVKMRKFVFRDHDRTQLMLDGLEGAHILTSPTQSHRSSFTSSHPPSSEFFDPATASDIMTDRHGCPAYVSPEIINCCAKIDSQQTDHNTGYSTNVIQSDVSAASSGQHQAVGSMGSIPHAVRYSVPVGLPLVPSESQALGQATASSVPSDSHAVCYASRSVRKSDHVITGYSGRAAEVWSLGVILYTMLIGRYPFHDVEPNRLFSKILRCKFLLPDMVVSPTAKCLIRSLLRGEPSHRLTVSQISAHPWFTSPRHDSVREVGFKIGVAGRVGRGGREGVMESWGDIVGGREGGLISGRVGFGMSDSVAECDQNVPVFKDSSVRDLRRFDLLLSE